MQPNSPRDDSAVRHEPPRLVTCPVCAHPNLEFRNHCRRCGGRLHGSANLIPGVDFVEWTATDGERPFGSRRPRIGVPVTLLILFVLVAAGMFFPLRPLMPALAILIILVLLGVSVFRARGTRQASIAEEPPEGIEKGLCPNCESDISEIDDVCPKCGAIVAFENLRR